MSGYQTFPYHAGSSDSLSKLYAIALPPLAGKSFLDVGCSEGFFCGYAFFNGAKEVLGIDKDKNIIKKAMRFFPFCKFAVADWDDLSEKNKYDVILCSSSLHYANDQPALIDKLVRLLKPNGVLVLEVGIAPGAASEWVEVKRTLDTRLFPTWKAITDFLGKYAFKCLGNSVEQAGDPLPRKIFHVSKRKPYAALLMGPSGSGKSSIARNLFKDVQVISGDEILRDINKGNVSVSQNVKGRIAEVSNPNDPSLVLSHLLFCNGWQEFFSIVAGNANQRDFVFDGFVPMDYHGVVASFFKSCGYFVINLSWDSSGAEQDMKTRINSDAKKYTMFLSSYMKFVKG